jgi:hypothetical protein
MDNEIKLQKYRKLSVVSLVTGILSVSVGILYNFLWMFIGNFLRVHIVDVGLIPKIVLPILGIVFGTAIVAVVCGSIDLKRIMKGIYTIKGKRFDITGIVLGGFFILIVVIFLFGEIFSNH